MASVWHTSYTIPVDLHRSLSLSLSSRPACSSCSVANGSLWFPGSAPEMFSCGDLVRSALRWSLRLPLGLSTLFIPRPLRPQTAKWVELWPVMWSGLSVTRERPESVELTTLLTIKRQPDTTSSSSPLLSKTGTANPCPPEEGLSTANQPMSQAASLSCQSCQAGRKQPKHVLPVPLFCFCLFHTYFCPMCLPVSVALIKLLPSVFFNHPPCHFSFFFPLPFR